MSKNLLEEFVPGRHLLLRFHARFYRDFSSRARLPQRQNRCLNPVEPGAA